MGLDGNGFWRASVRLTAACVTTYAEEIIGGLLCTGKSSIFSETCSNDVLVMYNVRH